MPDHDQEILNAIYSADPARLQQRLDALTSTAEKTTVINAPDADGQTYLHIVSRIEYPPEINSNFINIIELLINNGIDINLIDKKNCSAICNAAYRGKVEEVKTLLKYNANIFQGYATGNHNTLMLPMTRKNHELLPQLSDNLSTCINLLFDHYAGIGVSFDYDSNNWLKDFDFTGKILLLAEFDEILIKKNPSTAHAITTFDQLKVARENQQIADEQIRGSFNAATAILHVLAQGKQPASLLHDLIFAMQIEWPSLKELDEKNKVQLPGGLGIFPPAPANNTASSQTRTTTDVQNTNQAPPKKPGSGCQIQ